MILSGIKKRGGVMIRTIVGFSGFTFSTIALFPQIYCIYTSKSVKDISWFMLINFLISSLCWGLYGFMTKAVPVLATNVCTFICAIILLSFKSTYGKE